MAKFPRVQRMCPFRNSIAEHMDGDLCRLCDRRVHDLGTMSDAQREAFLASCSEEICVSYALPRKRHVAAVALSAAVMALPVAADESAPSADAQGKGAATVFKGVIEALDYEPSVVIVIGGIKDFSEIEYVEHAEDAAEPDAPELPVTYEDEKN